MRSKEDDYKKDNNVPVYIYGGAVKVTGDNVFKNNDSEAFGRDTFYNKHDAGFVKVSNMQ
jgi:hypothetical protein